MKYSMLNDMAFNPGPLELVDLTECKPVKPDILEKAIRHNKELVDSVRKRFQILQQKNDMVEKN